MGSGFPTKRCPNVHDSGQVYIFQGKNRLGFRAITSSLSLETMTAEQAAQLDAEMQALLLPFAQDGLLTLSVVGGMTWGKPESGFTSIRDQRHSRSRQPKLWPPHLPEAGDGPL